ncbi:hypothetical protein BKA70DRAFT_341691 [Coprinopsis sp. MPI-PUGE-AT-0042]|nr:hypothetical protein BKA70DRAFT_341691 [Coprinopsis sp. MPI-PUGE-AT-0042]
MSSSFTYPAAPSTHYFWGKFSFPRLFAINQQSNSHVRNMLVYWRACHRPTHHAKRRASSLNLRVDTVKAINCAQKHVSTIPLPVLELESPPPVQLVYPQGCAPIHIEEADNTPVIPQEEDYESDCSSSASSMSMSSQSSVTSFEEDVHTMDIVAQPAKKAQRPVLRCIIPQTGNTPPVERSYFSSDSEYSAVGLDSAYDIKMESSPAHVLAAPQATYPNQGRLCIPEDIPSRPLSWGCSETTASSINSPSSDGRSSSAPLTPIDDIHVNAPLMPVRIKRKSAAMDEDSDESDISSSEEIRRVFDKRPRFERKSWNGIVEGGQPIRRPAAPAPFLYSSAKRYADASRAPTRF